DPKTYAARATGAYPISISALGAPPEIRTAVKVSRVSEAMASTVIAGSLSSPCSDSSARDTEGTRCPGERTPVLAPISWESGSAAGPQVVIRSAHGIEQFVRAVPLIWIRPAHRYDAMSWPLMIGWTSQTNTYDPGASAGTAYQRV